MVDRKRNWKERKNSLRLFITFCFIFVMFFGLTGIVGAEDNRVPTEPPVVLYHSPDSDAVQVPINGSISVVWDRPMQLSTQFTVTGPEGFMPGSFLYNQDTYTVTFLPDDGFLPDTRYGVLVTGQVDANGLVQRETYHWNFSTVTPTSVSIVSFGSTDENLGQDWLWSSWPWLMVTVSVLSLIGFLFMWHRRRLISLSS